MVYCSVPFCNSKSGRSKGVSFHEYPSDPEQRAAWVKAVSRKDSHNKQKVWEPTERSVICSQHFKPEDFSQGYKIKKLKPDVIPSVFNSYSRYLHTRQKRTPRKLVRPTEHSKLSIPDTRTNYQSENSLLMILANVASTALSDDNQQTSEGDSFISHILSYNEMKWR